MENYNPDNQINNHKESLVRQGEGATDVFSCRYKYEATREIYEESRVALVNLIQNLLKPNLNMGYKYEFADLGSFKGELLGGILAELPNYNFHTTAVDINEDALRENHADQKLIAILDCLPIKENSQDIVLARYVLQWNSQEEQKDILKEIVRITKGVAIVQHVGADSENPNEWRISLDDLFSGQTIPKLKREGYFFSSRNEIEKWFEENNFNFRRAEEKRVNNLSDLLTEKYCLNEEETKEVKNVFGEKDYIIQTTWLIFPKTNNQ